MGELQDKVALVTGSTRGLGRAIAERFAAEGATVVISGRDPGVTEKVAASLPGAIPLAADLGQPEECARLVDATVEARGRIDIVVNNAGVAVDNYILGVTQPRWQQVMDVNLSGAFYVLQAAARHMRRDGGGSIVNVISWAGLRGNIGQIAYSASKAGLVGVTITAAKELAPFGIRVNALSPAVESDMTAQMRDELFEEARARIPLGRLGRPEEIAEGALFLAGDRSSFITGQVLNLDGGMHLR
jgi:3-oxoacyl-[acyl-carrier protein] reductase